MMLLSKICLGFFHFYSNTIGGICKSNFVEINNKLRKNNECLCMVYK